MSRIMKEVTWVVISAMCFVAILPSTITAFAADTVTLQENGESIITEDADITIE